MSTFEEQYNYDYYQTLIENLGYVKEVDWNESKISMPEVYDERLDPLVERILKRNKLHIGRAKNVNEFLDKYADKIFDLLDKSYVDIYGTVPFTDGMKKMLIDNFKMIVDLKYVGVLVDENDNAVCFAVSFPSIAKAVRKSDGHLTPAALVRLLKAIKNPKVIDFGLVGVDPAYKNRGIGAAVTSFIMKFFKNGGIEYAETNLNLEDNADIQNLWGRFGRQIHKKRRAYIKKLEV